MSRHADKMDLKIAYEGLANKLANLYVGERYPDVEAALERLKEQFAETHKAIEIAEQRHKIDTATSDRQRAEVRLAELET